MATSLESQLIRGAGQAVAKDPYGIVAQAQRRTGEKLTSGLTAIGAKLAEKKKERELEEEKLQKEKDNELKGYDDNWETNQTETIDNQGLGKIAWGQATDLAEKQKAIYDACPPGQEGNRCRRGAIIDLKTMAQKYSDQKDSLQGYVDTQNKIKSGEIDLSKAQSEDAKKILAGLNDRNSSNRMKNDDEIAELRESLKTVSPEEQMGIEQEIEALEKSNERVVGWDIPGADEHGNKFGFMTAEDLDKANLLPVAALDIKTGFKTQQDSALEIAENLKTGAKGGKKYDLDKEAAIYGESITSENMKSVFKDPLYGGTETIEDHLRQNPVITNLDYADLGIDVTADLDEDGIIDPEEWVKLSATDVDKVINEISNNEDLAKLVGGNYMALKADRAVKTELYGDEYFPNPTGPNNTYTDKDRTLDLGDGEGLKVYPTIQALREAIEWDRTHLRNNGRENTGDFDKRGGIEGLLRSGEVYVREAEGVIKKSVKTDFELNP